jgi:hypothetical protein
VQPICEKKWRAKVPARSEIDTPETATKITAISAITNTEIDIGVMKRSGPCCAPRAARDQQRVDHERERLEHMSRT